jgi:hypothetical protein
LIELYVRPGQIDADILLILEELTAASSQLAAPASTGEIIALDVSLLLMSYDDIGQPVYKAKGGQYQKFGVRVWPEVLPTLGVDHASLTCANGAGTGKPGLNPANLKVNVLMGEKGPRKAI